jgi:drug/metabolite transporter (DMT)-like permease
MESTLLIAVLAGLAGMFGWGFADFFAKKTIDKVGDLATLTWAHIYGAVVIASLLLARSLNEGQAVQFPTSPRELGPLVFFGVLQAMVYYYAYKGFAVGKLSLLNPVFSSFPGIVVILSVVIFGEVLGGWQLASILVVFLGVLTLNIDHESLALRKLRLLKIPGMRHIVVAALLASVWTVLWGYFVSEKDWLVYASLMYFFMCITTLIICFFQKVKLDVVDGQTWKYFLLIGLSEVIAYVGLTVGYSLTSHVSIVAVLSGAFSIPTVVLAHIFLKERITKLQILGAFIVVAGVIVISLV